MELAVASALLAVALLGFCAILPSARWAHHQVIALVCAALVGVAVVISLVADATPGWQLLAVAVTSIAAATLGGWTVTATILHLTLNLPLRESTGSLPASGWIGLVERFGFSLSLVLGLPEVAALLLAVKALGSYAVPDDKDNTTPAARVLGTLTSVAWALVAAAPYLILGR